MEHLRKKCLSFFPSLWSWSLKRRLYVCAVCRQKKRWCHLIWSPGEFLFVVRFFLKKMVWEEHKHVSFRDWPPEKNITSSRTLTKSHTHTHTYKVCFLSVYIFSDRAYSQCSFQTFRSIIVLLLLLLQLLRLLLLHIISRNDHTT